MSREHSSSEAQPKVFLEGVFVAGGEPDPDGDSYDTKDGVRHQEFLDHGYIMSHCGSAKLEDIIGHPVKIERDGEDLKLTAQITRGDAQALALTKADLGFALAGVIHKRDNTGRITALEIKSVAIVPANKLTDPRCRCYLMEE